MVKFRHLLAALLVCSTLVISCAFAQSNLTQIRDLVTNPDGTPFNGTLVVTWNGYASSGAPVSQLSASAHIYNGALSILLVPTTTAPAGTYYQVIYNSSDGTVTWNEVWQVPPSTTPLTLSQVRQSSTQGIGSGGSGGGGGLQYATLPISISQVSNLSADLNTINTQLSALGAVSVSSLTSTVNGLVTTVGGLTTTVNGLTASVTGNTSSITSLTNTVNGLTASVAANTSSIGSLTTTVNGQTASLTTLTGTVNAQGTSITGLNASVSGLTTSVGANTTGITNLQTSVASLNSTVSGLNTSLTNGLASLATLTTTVGTQGTSLTNLTSTVTTLGTTVAGNTASLSGLNTTVGGLNTSVTNLDNTVAGLTTTVNMLSAGGTNAVFVDAEMPAGTINGSNTVFTLGHAPAPSASLTLFRNGLVQAPGVDFYLAGAVVTFITGSVPQTGDVMQAFYRIPGNGAATNFVDAETPGGAINGVNLTFTLAAAPNPASALKLYKNGLLLAQGGDYTLAGSTITFSGTATTPLSGDSLLAAYRH